MNAPSSLEAREAARIFVEESGWSEIVAAELAAQATADPEIALALLMPWPGIGRQARALQLVDTELRRAATAWRTVRLNADAAGTLLDDLPETALDVQPFHAALRRHDRPTPGCGQLQLQAARAHPHGVLCSADGALADLLARIPAASLAYAFSAFGQDVIVCRGQVEPPRIGLGFDALTWSLRLANDLQSGQVTMVRKRQIPGRPAAYRAVTGEHEEDSPNAPVAVLLSERREATDLEVTLVTLAAKRTELYAYGEAWRSSFVDSGTTRAEVPTSGTRSDPSRSA